MGFRGGKVKGRVQVRERRGECKRIGGRERRVEKG
jgi:hypothetical protein